MILNVLNTIGMLKQCKYPREWKMDAVVRSMYMVSGLLMCSAVALVLQTLT